MYASGPSFFLSMQSLRFDFDVGHFEVVEIDRADPIRFRSVPDGKILWSAVLVLSLPRQNLFHGHKISSNSSSTGATAAAESALQIAVLCNVVHLGLLGVVEHWCCAAVVCWWTSYASKNRLQENRSSEIVSGPCFL